MTGTARIPVSGRGLTKEQVGAVLDSAELGVDSAATAPQSVNMDPATATLVVGLATAVPALITSIAGAWALFRKGSSPAACTVVVETATDEVVLRVVGDGTLAAGDGGPVNVMALPSSPRDIVRIHLQ
jgi:hypothetical protein